MKKRHIILLAIGVAFALLLGVPMAISAAGGGDAIAGLKEFYNLLVQLAQQGLNAYIEFLKAI